MKVVNIKLKKEQFQLSSNTAGVLSKIASYEVPRGHSLVIRNDEPTYMKITAKEVINAQITSDPFTLTLSHRPAKGPNPSQQGYAVANGNRYEIVSIDPDSKQVQISGPTTDVAVDIIVYYAIGEGSYQVAIEKPMGNSVEREAVMVGSLSELNSRDIYDTAGAFVMQEMLLREEWELLILVDTQAEIDLNNDAALIQIPATILDEEATQHVLALLLGGGE